MEKFQSRLAAGEVRVYHHAEFQPEVESDSEAHSRSHDHDHSHRHLHQKDGGRSHSRNGHTHAPYRHIAHPHGPRTMIDENVYCCFMSQFPQSVVDEERALRLASGKSVVDQIPQCKVK